LSPTNPSQVKQKSKQEEGDTVQDKEETMEKVKYKQVNYMKVLDQIISEQYVDDKLTQFLNILS
jgi:uncharacterized protein YjgD (DUF1641 family)